MRTPGTEITNLSTMGWHIGEYGVVRRGIATEQGTHCKVDQAGLFQHGLVDVRVEMFANEIGLEKNKTG